MAQLAFFSYEVSFYKQKFFRKVAWEQKGFFYADLLSLCSLKEFKNYVT